MWETEGGRLIDRLVDGLSSPFGDSTPHHKGKARLQMLKQWRKNKDETTQTRTHIAGWIGEAAGGGVVTSLVS